MLSVTGALINQVDIVIMESMAQELISSDETVMALVLDLRKQLEAAEQRAGALEEECDLLAEDNERLRSLCRARGVDPDSVAAAGKQQEVEEAQEEDVEEFLVDAGGDGRFARLPGRDIANACGTGNALCVDFIQFPEDEGEERFNYIVCGGVDKTVRIYSLESREVLFHHEFSAPILAIDSAGALVACSMMDGSYAVISLGVRSCKEIGGDFSPQVIRNDKDHTKYVVSIKWSSDGGRYLVTASHDKSVILYESEMPSSGLVSIKHRISLREVPEDVVFCTLPATFTSSVAGSTSNGLDTPYCPTSKELDTEKNLHIVVPTRGVPYLLYINCETLAHRKVSLNENIWDSHVSFNVLQLSVSPDGRLLLVATDKDFHVIFRTGTNKRLSLLAGHMCNEYGKPKTAWDQSGKYVYSNNQADYDIMVYAINTGKIVHSLKGHGGQIRDIKANHSCRSVLSASYDHHVKEWTQA